MSPWTNGRGRFDESDDGRPCAPHVPAGCAAELLRRAWIRPPGHAHPVSQRGGRRLHRRRRVHHRRLRRGPPWAPLPLLGHHPRRAQARRAQCHRDLRPRPRRALPAPGAHPQAPQQRGPPVVSEQVRGRLRALPALQPPACRPQHRVVPQTLRVPHLHAQGHPCGRRLQARCGQRRQRLRAAPAGQHSWAQLGRQGLRPAVQPGGPRVGHAHPPPAHRRGRLQDGKRPAPALPLCARHGGQGPPEGP